jgi:hypothetical protein
MLCGCGGLLQNCVKNGNLDPQSSQTVSAAKKLFTVPAPFENHHEKDELLHECEHCQLTVPAINGVELPSK